MPRKKEHVSRHAPAFILLFLARGCDYGGSLLTAMRREMPHFFGDSAATYRALRSLEKEECIVSRWKVRQTGRPKRIYSLTPKGWQRLEEYAADIQMRLENFRFFLTSLEAARQTRQRATEDCGSALAGTVPKSRASVLSESEVAHPAETATEGETSADFETRKPITSFPAPQGTKATGDSIKER
ncbi:transcriptional regulator PadR-like family protein [Peptococcaceae bacterium CEB3]|nr:transcriptional regulator PadR-like family protein [Peptococcaceae bacterium CEB3]